jgi:tRNA A-37 threonylcarbamoyl transferase component Bud32
MAFVDINPRYREVLARQGLRTAQDFLRLSGMICCGHPDRHVAQVKLGEGAESFPAYLKKEHRVRWKDRVGNAWAGFGFVSKSRREMEVLKAVAGEGIRGPEFIAAGEHGGRAFLLLREMPGTDLWAFLKERRNRDRRRSFAKHLGVALAEIHAGGFDHPDLYSKHILVRTTGLNEYALCFLDWQRSRRRKQVPWSIRCRDLAALEATLAEQFASPRERLLCLRSYLRYAGLVTKNRQQKRRLAEAARQILHFSRRLLRRPRIRELRQPSLPPGTQSLIWLDGEALCVTREFQEQLQGQIPAWLEEAPATPVLVNEVRREVVPLDKARPVRLVRRWASRPWAWLLSLIRRRRVVSPELQQAAALFRLERFGVGIPRLLAVGQRPRRLWRLESFLLTEPVQGAMGLRTWLAGEDPARISPAGRKERWFLFRQLGEVLRRVHEAGYFLGRDKADLFAVRQDQSGDFTVYLHDVDGLYRQARARRGPAAADLFGLNAELAAQCSRSERLRLLLGYLDLPRLTPAAKDLVRGVFSGRADAWPPAVERGEGAVHG